MKAKHKQGQAMVEYIIIVGIVAIAALGIFGLFGKTLNKKMEGVNKALGSSSVTELGPVPNPDSGPCDCESY